MSTQNYQLRTPIIRFWYYICNTHTDTMYYQNTQNNYIPTRRNILKYLGYKQHSYKISQYFSLVDKGLTTSYQISMKETKSNFW